MEKKYYLYLTNYLTQESKSHEICSHSDLDVIRNSIMNIIRAMFSHEEYWWYSEKYVKDKAEELTKPFIGLLEDGSLVTKRKYPFYHLGFIITNYPMWPDNKGGYESEFCY